MTKGKKGEEKPTEQEKLIETYYMLARVIDHNTQIFNAFINMISAKEAEIENSSSTVAPPAVVHTKTDVSNVLTNIVETCGKKQAKKFLDSFNAKTVSDVETQHYDVFIKSGNYMVKHYKGDVI